MINLQSAQLIIMMVVKDMRVLVIVIRKPGGLRVSSRGVILKPLVCGLQLASKVTKDQMKTTNCALSTTET